MTTTTEKSKNYFAKAKTKDELKSIYKELVKKYHPDVFGDKGNEILKEVHAQLEKAVKTIDKGYFTVNDFIDEDTEETPETRAKKEQICKEYSEKYGAFACYYLFAAYWENNLKPANHRNPLTKHNFTGWNVWQLELQMYLKGYKSAYWSTFAQYKEKENFVRKGEKGTGITLAIYSKKKQEEIEPETDEQEIRPQIYYRGYTVFNHEQTYATAEKSNVKAIAQIKQIVQTIKKPEQKTLNLWQEKYVTVA